MLKFKASVTSMWDNRRNDRIVFTDGEVVTDDPERIEFLQSVGLKGEAVLTAADVKDDPVIMDGIMDDFVPEDSDGIKPKSESVPPPKKAGSKSSKKK